MKLPKLLLLTAIISLFVSIHPVKAANKVAVIPLGGGSPAFKGDIYHTVPFSSFMPMNDNVTYRQGWTLAALGYLETRTNTSSAFTAPLNLPNKAVIKEIALSAEDHENSNEIKVFLQYFPLTEEGSGGIIPANEPLSSEGIGTDQRDLVTLAVDNAVIDNENYYYILYAWFFHHPSDRLNAVRIKYSLP